MAVYRCELHGQRDLLEAPDCKICEPAATPDVFKFRLAQWAAELSRQSLLQLIRVQVVKK